MSAMTAPPAVSAACTALRASKRADLDEAGSFLDGVYRGIDGDMSSLRAAERCIENGTGRRAECREILALLEQAMEKVELLEKWCQQGAPEGE